MRLSLAVCLQLLATVATVLACPKIVENICKCEDLGNGVILDCSHSDGADVMQLLRQNQSLFGLVQSLTLQKANLRRLPASFLAGLYIKQLDLSHNQLVELDDNAFQGMSPVLQELILTHNNLTKIPVGALSAVPTLMRLDLSNNSITDLLEEDSLPNLPKLFDINLGANKICNVHSTVFQKVKNTVQTINLGHNCLKAVPSQSIRGLSQLQSIHMHYNNISALDALSFLNLPVLNLLNLAGNSIKELNRQAFLNVPNLRYLYLTENKISKLSPHQFATFEKMEFLDLTGNVIETLPKSSLAQLTALSQLYLGNNLISHIENDVFTNSSIKILVLSGNRLKELNEGVLDGLPSIQHVSFAMNQIKTINNNAFYNAPTITMVDLSHNEISELSPSTFLAQFNLLLIDLKNNKLAHVPYAAFNRRVGTVMLEENPVVCSEKVHRIQDGVGIYFQNQEDLICGGHPTTTTTTPAPVQMKKMSLRRPSADAPKPSGAFQQAGLVQSTSEEQIPLLPTRSEDSGRAAILNARPAVITRSRGLHGSDIAHTSLKHESAEALPVQEMETEMTAEDSESEVPLSKEESKEEQTEDATEPHVPSVPVETPSEMQPIVPIVRTTTLGPRVYTDIADNPNLIHPFPVPFLKRGPGIHQATRIKASTPMPAPEVEEPRHTLPPSIVIAPRIRPATTEVKGNEIESTEKFEQFALQADGTAPKTELKTKSSSSLLASPTTIIIICLTTVGIVMIAVFIVLCVARHRQAGRFTSSYSDSSAARTNAYVSAQAQQMNMIYGSLGRNGYSTQGHTMTLPRDDAQPWLGYNPGPNYSNYYHK